MIDKREFKKTVNGVFKEAGYKEKSGAWYLASEDMVVVVEMQKSNYDNTFFVNVGFYLRRLGDELEPRERHCHIRCRADRIIPTDGAFDAMNLDTGDAHDLEQFLKTILMPRVRELMSLGKLRTALDNGSLRACFVHAAALEVLTSR